MKYIDYLATYNESSQYIVEDRYLPGLREGAKNGDLSQDYHLSECLKKLYPHNTFLRHKFIKLDGKCVKNLWGSKICVDYICEELKMIIEFDGESWQGGGHFTDPNVCLKDQYNTSILKHMGYNVIRIPYYVQLDKYAIKHYFDLDYDDELYKTCSDHGFLYPDCKTPGYFCELGLDRFYNDLITLPSEISLTIINSLMMRFLYNLDSFSDSIIDDRYIIPTSLSPYINSICNEKIINISKFILIDSGYKYWVMPEGYTDFYTPMDADSFSNLMCINCGYDISEYANYIEMPDDKDDPDIYCHWVWKSDELREKFISNYIRTS